MSEAKGISPGVLFGSTAWNIDPSVRYPTGSRTCDGLPQDLTLGPEVARQFADAMTLLYRRPVDPATIESADLAGLFRLQEVRDASKVLARSLSPASCEAF